MSKIELLHCATHYARTSILLRTSEASSMYAAAAHYDKFSLLLDVRTMTGSVVKLDSPKSFVDITSIEYSMPGSKSLIMAEFALAG